MQSKTLTTSNVQDTIKLGEQLGIMCRGGEVFELISDLGGGKTAFVRGLSKGLGTEDEVSSPSFTINNTYKGSRFNLEHFDFYRLDDPGVIAEELKEDIYDTNSIVAVEWGDIVHDILPEDRIMVKIITDENDNRNFTFNFPSSYDYLFTEI